jgi:hypothetical protein
VRNCLRDREIQREWKTSNRSRIWAFETFLSSICRENRSRFHRFDHLTRVTKIPVKVIKTCEGAKSAICTHKHFHPRVRWSNRWKRERFSWQTDKLFDCLKRSNPWPGWSFPLSLSLSRSLSLSPSIYLSLSLSLSISFSPSLGQFRTSFGPFWNGKDWDMEEACKR